MTTPLQALEQALRTGNNATEVMNRLQEAGFVVVNQEALTRFATEVVKVLPGMANQAEPIAKTIITASIMGATLDGMWKQNG